MSPRPKLWKPTNTSLKETKNFTIQPMYVFIGLFQKVGQGLYDKGNEIYLNCGIKWPRASSLCLDRPQIECPFVIEIN